MRLLERAQKDADSVYKLSRIPLDESGAYSCATCKKGFSSCRDCPSNQTST